MDLDNLTISEENATCSHEQAYKCFYAQQQAHVLSPYMYIQFCKYIKPFALQRQIWMWMSEILFCLICSREKLLCRVWFISWTLRILFLWYEDENT